MKLSYCITVCTEFIEIQKLLHLLIKNKREEDEIVVIYDSKNGNGTIPIFFNNDPKNEKYSWYEFEFERDFSALKNFGKSKCSGDWILHLDADEYPHETLMEQLPQIIEMNDVDLIWLPRVNTVDGITDEHIQKWGWRVSEKGWVNYPDYQARVFRNKEGICWQGKVHEHIIGCETYSHLPPYEELSLYHPKTIDKQEKQNELYEGIMK